MKHKYFGILTEEMHNTLSDEEMLNFLNKNHLIESYIPPTFIEERKTDEKNGFERVIRFYQKDKTNRFSSHLIKEVYSFLKLFMSSSIEINLLMFKKNFEINNFGISEKKQKKSALKIFKEFFFLS
ncbi:MAG: hypothetical protein V3V28_06495 [Polaribacter sp.]|uniref:hypothetical protein n=1 Tax=Polaribacter sp. TaxID=1920175 RepID=UPI002F34F4D9